MNNQYTLYIQEKLDKFGKISFKKMFGGVGVYANKLFIGIIAYGELYFKTNNDIINTYKQHNSEQFCYISPNSNKEIRMNWWKVVDEILEDEELLSICYAGALKAAKQTTNTNKTKKLHSKINRENET